MWTSWEFFFFFTWKLCSCWLWKRKKINENNSVLHSLCVFADWKTNCKIAPRNSGKMSVMRELSYNIQALVWTPNIHCIVMYKYEYIFQSLNACTWRNWQNETTFNHSARLCWALLCAVFYSVQSKRNGNRKPDDDEKFPVKCTHTHTHTTTCARTHTQNAVW